MKKVYLIIVLFVLILSILGCQQNPGKNIVASKRIDLNIEKAVKDEEVVYKEQDFKKAEYISYGFSEENFKKSNRFEVSFYTDIMKTAAEKYPLEKVCPKVISQEYADKVVKMLMPNAKNYVSYPTPQTKQDYSYRLVELKKMLADSKNGLSSIPIKEIESMILNTEDKIRLAIDADVVEKKFTDTNFNFKGNYSTGILDENSGKNFIFIGEEDDYEDIVSSLYISKYDKHAGSTSNIGFQKYNSMYTLIQYEQEKEDIDSLEASTSGMDELTKADVLKSISDKRHFFDDYKKIVDKYAMNTKNTDFYINKAIAVLSDLNINDVQIKNHSKALATPFTGDNLDNINFEKDVINKGEPCYYIEFVRECGDIPCVVQKNSTYTETDEQVYKPTMFLEEGSMLFTKGGSLIGFEWYNISEKIEQIASDATLLNIDEIKEKLVNQLYYMYAYPNTVESNLETYGIKVKLNIESAYLKYAYINAKDEPDNAVLAPAWHFKIKEKITYDNDLSSFDNYGYMDVLINAVDGAFIVMPT